MRMKNYLFNVEKFVNGKSLLELKTIFVGPIHKVNNIAPTTFDRASFIAYLWPGTYALCDSILSIMVRNRTVCQYVY